MKHIFHSLTFGLGLLLAGGLGQAQAQVALSTSPYTENFNTIGQGLPGGFSVYTGATATALGTAGNYGTAATAWNNSAGAFKNFASATGLTASASAADQAASTNRALGVRQTGAFGDPGAAFAFQVTNTTGRTGFALSFALQSLDNTSTRSTVWTVDYGLGANPTSFTPVPGATGTTSGTFGSTPITVSFGSALDNQSGPVTIRVVTLAASTGSGTRPSTALDDWSLSWNSPAPNSPTLTLAPTSLAFPAQAVGTTSASRTYQLTGANLTDPTTLTVTGPFSISKDGTTFGTTLTYSAAELATTQTVSVRFTPTAGGAVGGAVVHASTGATNQTLSLTGTGVDPNQTTFSFDNCTGTTALSDGWTQQSVAGAQLWTCTTFGRNPSDPTLSAPNGVQINGFAGGANNANEDWLISPALNLSATNFPLLSFWSRVAFSGASLRLRVSTNYSGSGAPGAATWTELPVQFPASGSNVWTQTRNVNLTAFKASAVYVAFVYTSTTTDGARWTLDDIAVTNSTTAPPPALFADASRLTFGFTAPGTTTSRPLNVSATDLTGDVTISSSDPAFTLSRDGNTFSQSLTLPRADASGNSRPVTVRFAPTVANRISTATLTLSTPGVATSPTVALTGDTYDPTRTLEVVNWNIEWFGSADPNLGPADKNLQRDNVIRVLTALSADVYAMQEVVDTVRFRAVVTALSAATGFPYAYKTSPYGSYADDTNDPDYVGAQKLSFIYRTDVISNPSFVGLLRCTQAQNCPAFNAWASGRFPWQMTATVTLGGQSQRMRFVNIHAKANSTATSANDYARRQTGANLLKAQFDQTPTDNILLLGDFNDVLNGTIATGVSPAVSSYNSFLTDPNYVPLTLALAQSGAQSTVSFPTVIDNKIASRSMANLAILPLTAVRTDVTALVANYATTTSDHYPVFSRYALTGGTLSTKAGQASRLGLYPNPVGSALRLDLSETGPLSLRVYTSTGQAVLQGSGLVEQLNQQLGQQVGRLAPGLYLLQVQNAAGQTYAQRFVKE